QLRVTRRRRIATARLRQSRRGRARLQWKKSSRINRSPSWFYLDTSVRHTEAGSLGGSMGGQNHGIQGKLLLRRVTEKRMVLRFFFANVCNAIQRLASEALSR